MVQRFVFLFSVDRHIELIYVQGYTPLFAAISGRHWSTAKLIVAISAAQYAPDDENTRFKFNKLLLGMFVFLTNKQFYSPYFLR